MAVKERRQGPLLASQSSDVSQNGRLPAVLHSPSRCYCASSLARTAAVHEAEVAAILGEYEEARTKRVNKFKTADESVAKTDRIDWFNRNGWPEHLARRNLRHLSCASRMPDHSEQALLRYGDTEHPLFQN